ncbi:isochorismate synthase [Flavobacterium columnare]|nr:isochorismate synthase [Flavobacterium columnare]AMO19461.1 isochorismate synthase [Flavobacterium columnare]MBF6652736.1 isochorismate synthase [Flavobacterium columnare]MBF6654572.1 isochorismate synthase [Flavobacterium columnare]MBF6659010.1 isochorismate synthase [Flavobacterium columnare]MEB3800205.1 isochorismate synthase [Flavobacterium columnare]
MKSIFERVRIQQKMNLPFVLYRKPNTKTLVGIFQENDHIYFTENFTEEAFVFAPFDGVPIIFPLEKAEIKYNSVYFDHLIQELETNILEDQIEKQSFIELVENGIKTIKTGVFDKVVLSRTEMIQINHFDLFTSFEQMLFKYPSALCYTWYHPKIGLWMGATPEKLFAIKENKFQTMALAGTQVVKNEECVLWGDKEKKEQQFVTDFIKQELGSVVTDLQVSEAYTSKAGNLFHLKTDIKGRIKEVANLKKIIDVLHPTPAVCGVPKNLTKTFIEKSEGYDREFYTGFLGELNIDCSTNEKATDLYVNLRCMKVSENKINLFMGCGVTEGSHPELEWYETLNKSKTMRMIINNLKEEVV